MASLLRKAKHAGKARVKFRFDVTVHSLRALEGPQANPLSVVWTRGPRVATTTSSCSVSSTWLTSISDSSSFSSSRKSGVAGTLISSTSTSMMTGSRAPSPSLRGRLR